MEFLSAVTMFSSAFLGLTASLIGFLLLAFWGAMLVWGVKVERPLYKMLSIVLASIGISMLLGLYESGVQAHAFPGGVFGHWVGERCAASGTVGFFCFLLWLAVAAGLLLATDWLFIGFFFGGKGPVPVTGGLGAAFSKSIGIFSPSARGARRQSGPEEYDLQRGSFRSFLGSFGRFRRRDRDPEEALSKAKRVPDRPGVGHARPKAKASSDAVPTAADVSPTFADVSPTFAEEETSGRLDSGSSVAPADVGEGSVADTVVDSDAWKVEDGREGDSAAWWKSETFEKADTEKADTDEAGTDEAGTDETDTDEAGTEEESTLLAERDIPVQSASAYDGEALYEEGLVLEKSWWTAPSERRSEDLPEPEVESIQPEVESTEPEVEEILSEGAPEVPDIYDEAVDERDLEEEEPEEGGNEVTEAPEAPVEEEPAQELEKDPEEELEDDSGEELEEDPGEEPGEPPAEEQRSASDEPEPQPQAEFSFSKQESPEPAAISDEEIDIFRRAVALVVERQKGSISLLQRELGLGYFKAAKLLTMLERQGVIAPYAGSIARKVTISEEQAARIIDGPDPL